MPGKEMTKDEYDVTPETMETEVPPVTCRSRFVSYVKSHLFMQVNKYNNTIIQHQCSYVIVMELT